MTASGYVYFIRGKHLGLIKIGYSKDPYQRLRELQQPNPDDLTLLAMRVGDVELEHALHARFADQRQRGEWFLPCPELMEEVAFAKTLTAIRTSDDGDVSDVMDHYVRRKLYDRPLIHPGSTQRFAWVGDGFWQGWEGF